jgi:hypothetical protein
MNKVIMAILLLFLFSCVINIGDVNQRHGELNRECKKLLKKQKVEVHSVLKDLEMGTPERVIATSDSTETEYFYKRYVSKRKDRYYDEIILDFTNNVLLKFKVNIVR